MLLFFSVLNMAYSVSVNSAILTMATLLNFCSLLYLPIQALEAFDIEFSHFNLVNINLKLQNDSMFDPNISEVHLEGVGKYGYDSPVKNIKSKLCYPKHKNKNGFKNGCRSSEYAGCAGTVALVDRGPCDMDEKANHAHAAKVKALIIVDLSSDKTIEIKGFLKHVLGSFGKSSSVFQSVQSMIIRHIRANFIKLTSPLLWITRSSESLKERRVGFNFSTLFFRLSLTYNVFSTYSLCGVHQVDWAAVAELCVE